MKYVPFSDTGRLVSNICVGTMNFFSRCDYKTSEAIVKTSWDFGVNFFDTAAMYSDGKAEEFLGTAIKGLPREKIFISTKAVCEITRENVIGSLDKSLQRLQSDYVDLFLIHWPHKNMNISKMMEILNEAVVSSKAKYVGVSNFPAYLLASSNAVAAKEGFARLCCNQVAYNLIERGIEIEILPQAVLDNIAIMAYRPLSMGLLTGKYHFGKAIDASLRGINDSRVITWLSQYGESIEKFLQYAEYKQISPVQLALSWILYSGAVTAPIVGASSEKHLKDTLAASEIQLDDNDYAIVSEIFPTEIKEEGLQWFPGTKYNFPRLRRNIHLAEK